MSPTVLQGLLVSDACAAQVLFFPAWLSPAVTQEIDQRHSYNGMILNVFPYFYVESYKRSEGNGNLLGANFFYVRPV